MCAYDIVVLIGIDKLLLGFHRFQIGLCIGYFNFYEQDLPPSNNYAVGREAPNEGVLFTKWNFQCKNMCFRL